MARNSRRQERDQTLPACALLGGGCLVLLIGWGFLGYVVYQWVWCNPHLTFPFALRSYWPGLLTWFLLSTGATCLFATGKAVQE